MRQRSRVVRKPKIRPKLGGKQVSVLASHKTFIALTADTLQFGVVHISPEDRANDLGIMPPDETQKFPHRHLFSAVFEAVNPIADDSN